MYVSATPCFSTVALDENVFKVIIWQTQLFCTVLVRLLQVFYL